jgi:hypothetical protein
MDKVTISTTDFKLSFTKAPDFKVTTSKKTGKKVITCILVATIVTPDINVAGDPLLDLFGWGENIITVTGKAVCSIDDNFNEEIGKAVARAKAESNAYKIASKMLHSRILLLDKVLDAAERFAEKARKVVNHNSGFINQVTDPTTDLYKKVIAVDAEAVELDN